MQDHTRDDSHKTVRFKLNKHLPEYQWFKDHGRVH